MEKEDKEKKGILTRVTDALWRFFSSVTLTVILLILLALASIPGTIIEQGSPEKGLRLMARIFGDAYAHQALDITVKLGLLDAYHSWWFVLLLVLLTSNLTICTLDRFPKTWRLIHTPQTPLNDAILASASSKAELRLKGGMEKAKETVSKILKDHRYNLSEKRAGNILHIFSEKGKYSRLGVYIIHLSVILIFIGGLIGASFGFKGFLNLPEGEVYSVAILRTGFLCQAEENEREQILNAIESVSGDISRAGEILGIGPALLNSKMKRYGIRPLGFNIRCDDFEVDFYEGTDMPKEYRSWLTVIQDGKEVVKKSIEVNAPLTYKGITFYQSSYGLMPNLQNAHFILSISSNSGVSETKYLKFNDKFNIPGTNMEGTIKDFSPALGIDKSGRAFTYTDMMNNPAVFIEFSEDGRHKYSGWILKRNPMTWRLPEGHIVEFKDLLGAQYTGLQVAKDPGLWIVYLGFALMSVGFIFAFFRSHKRLWARLREEKGQVIVTLAGNTNKNRIAFEREFEGLIKRFKEVL